MGQNVITKKRQNSLGIRWDKTLTKAQNSIGIRWDKTLTKAQNSLGIHQSFMPHITIFYLINILTSSFSMLIFHTFRFSLQNKHHIYHYQISQNIAFLIFFRFGSKTDVLNGENEKKLWVARVQTSYKAILERLYQTYHIFPRGQHSPPLGTHFGTRDYQILPDSAP